MARLGGAVKCQRHDKDIIAVDIGSSSSLTVVPSGMSIQIWCVMPRTLTGDRDIPNGFGYYKDQNNFSFVMPGDEETRAELHTLLQRETYEC